MYISSSFDSGNYKVIAVRKKSFDFIAVNEKRKNTVKYTCYLKNRKYYLRRFCKCGLFNQITPYQLFRNSHTGNWEAFSSIEKMLIRFDKYIEKINNKYN